MGQRLDTFLVDQGRVQTRSKAANLIKNSKVKVNGKIVLKTGNITHVGDKIEIIGDQTYVSRGAYKLSHALEEFNLDFKDKIIVDCGASTGGFTQVSLLNGAQKIYAIDVGHDQLDEKIKNDPRVINFEGVNLKNEFELPEKVDFCVADLSFISIKLVFHTMLSFLKEGGQCVVLIKPQFEAGRERVGRGGLVKESVGLEVLEEIKAWFESIHHPILKVCTSPIKGKTGNTEYLALIG